MDFDVFDSLDDLGYPNCDKAKEIIESGPKSIEFTQLIEWFSKELQSLYGLDSSINSITDLEDTSSFLMEVSSFLKELQCPYKSLITGSISQRLLDIKSRMNLLDFLCTELQAGRLLQRKTLKTRKIDTSETKMVETHNIVLSLDESMRNMQIDIESHDEPLSILSEMLEKICSNTNSVLVPAFDSHLTDDQWKLLTEYYQDMYSEYTIRRELMLTRLDVTLQSFKWGERCQSKEAQILDAYVYKRKRLKKEPMVKLTDVIAAREDIFDIEKTSSAELVKNTKSSLNRILIDAVPDRGGRAREQRPALEMPNWSKRSAGGRGDHKGKNRGDSHGRGKRFKEHKDGGGNFDAAGSY